MAHGGARALLRRDLERLAEYFQREGLTAARARDRIGAGRALDDRGWSD